MDKFNDVIDILASWISKQPQVFTFTKGTDTEKSKHLNTDLIPSLFYFSMNVGDPKYYPPLKYQHELIDTN